MSLEPVAQARSLLAAGDIAGASAIVRARVEAEPTDAAAWRLLARVAIGQGRAAEVVAALRQAVALEPLPPDSEGDLAAGMLILGDLDAAVWHIERALAGAPTDGVLWRRRAIIAERRKDDAGAERAHAEALRLSPDDGAAHNNYGVFLRRQGRAGDAVQALRRAAALEPTRVEYRINLAAALRTVGDLPGAIQSYRFAVMGQPEKEENRLALIGTLRESGLGEEAVAVASEASTHLPRSVPIHVARSAVLLDDGRAEEAEAAARAALALLPDDPDGWLHLGNALDRQGDRIGAIEAYRNALAQRADDPQALANLGVALEATGKHADARLQVEHAASIAPDNPEVLVAAGVVAQAAGDLAAAEARYRAALDRRPDYHEAAYDLGWLQLSQGRLAEGQPGFDRRWHLARFAAWKRHFDAPSWNGEPLDGKRLLVWGDHGPGDEILYARLLPLLLARAASVVVECTPRLVPLFRRSFPAAVVVPRADPPDPATRTVDLQCPTGSLLGRLCRTPADIAALPPARLVPDRAKAAALRERYADGRLLVGLSWRSAHPEIARAKSLPLVEWAPILATPGCRFVSVQYGDHRREIDAAAAATGTTVLLDPAVDPLTDLDLAAAQIAALDLVISVSNTGAHLAAGVGIETWALLGAGRELFWYWFRDRADSPWYPTVRLFRQPAPGQWQPTVATVAAVLAERAATGSA